MSLLWIHSHQSSDGDGDELILLPAHNVVIVSSSTNYGDGSRMEIHNLTAAQMDELVCMAADALPTDDLLARLFVMIKE